MISFHKNFTHSNKIFHRYPKLSIVFITMIFFLFLITVIEIFLRLFAPISITNTGFTDTSNGLRYGWGFNPYDIVRVQNPDTGRVHLDRVNNKGWRDRDRNYENPKNSFRVIILGDSETFGFTVPKLNTYSWLLEDRMKREGKNIEVINISYSGWSTSQQLEALKIEGMKYSPDLIIVHFVGNDLFENIIPKNSGKFSSRVPFYHEVNTDGKLMRIVNKKF